MTVTLNNEGQITIPEDLRASLHLEPGSEFIIRVDGGDLILRRQTSMEDAVREANFDRAIGSADIKWDVDELMALLRGDD